MASKRRKALPPWLQGVTVKKTKSDFVQKSENQSSGETQFDSAGKEVKRNSNSQVEKNISKSVKQIEDIQERTELQEKSADSDMLLALSYKEYLFTGSIIYSHDSADTNILCENILENMKEGTSCIGFDTEWPVTYNKGKQAKTALIQVCVNEEKCYLFHVSCMPKFPVMLKKLIETDSVKKIGLNVDYDIWKLGMDFDISAKQVVQHSTVELKALANKKLKSSENWSLEGLSRNVLRLRISKDPGIRKCDWSQFPLPETHQQYAATDAAVSLMIYNKLVSSTRR